MIKNQNLLLVKHKKVKNHITLFLWYIFQAHPDARQYRTKGVQNFSDLCLIYEHTTADGRYSRSSHDIDIDDEVNGVNLGKNSDSICCNILINVRNNKCCFIYMCPFCILLSFLSFITFHHIN